MSALTRAQDLLDRVVYRDVTFGVQPSDGPYGEYVSVYLMRTVEDVYNPGRPVLFGSHEMVPPFLLNEGNEDSFYDWLFRCVVLGAERHEAAEQFTVDGARPFDPHKEGN